MTDEWIRIGMKLVGGHWEKGAATENVSVCNKYLGLNSVKHYEFNLIMLRISHFNFCTRQLRIFIYYVLDYLENPSY